MQELWNKKFSRDGLLYGDTANKFIIENTHLLTKNGKILCLGEGEGRNAIYLAKKGFFVDALDASDVGLLKLQKRAENENVAITIRHTFIENWQPHTLYDAIISTYFHVEENLQKEVFIKVFEALKEGGYFIAEFFSTDQLNFTSGGPKDVELLYDLSYIHNLFSNLPYSILKLSQEVVNLSEGFGHNGEASVIRIILRKNS